MDEVGQVPNLERRGAVYRCRMRCPQHLLREGVPPEKSVSLHTKERSVALERLPAARVSLMEFFQNGTAPRARPGIRPSVQRARRPDHPDLPLLTISEAERLAQDFFRAAYAELDLASADLPGVALDRREQWLIELEDRIAQLDLGSADAEDPALGAEIGLLRREGRRAPYSSEPSRMLRGYLRRAMRQLWRIELSRAGGDYSDRITDIFFAPAASVPEGIQLPPRDGERRTLGEAVDRYSGELMAKARSDKTQDRYKAELSHISAFFGRDRLMSDFKRADCTAFRDAFAKLPPNFAKRTSIDLDIHRLIAGWKQGDPVLAHATLTKYLDALSRFTRWAHQEDLIDKDYGSGLEPLSVKPDGSVAKLPFERAELERFFRRPLYTGCIDDEYGFATPGTNIVRRARYWAPLIALFGGLRSGEIFQLTPRHFRVSDAGTPFIVLTKDMQLKNENAEREIPVHSTLIAVGLLKWVERRRTDAGALLFSEIKPDKYGSVSSPFGKRFRSDLKHLALGVRREKLTFHSFRHTFKRALDRKDVEEQEKDELCGWARAKKIGRRYGVGLEADRLKRALELVSYDLDLAHLLAQSDLID